MGKEDEQNAILFMFLGISVAVGISHVLSKYLNDFLPQTVVIFVIGVLIAELEQHNLLGSHLGHSIKNWEQIEAELILCSFLPALLFGEAMSLNWHQIKGAFSQSLLLAGPGVIIGAFLMGSIMYYVMGLGWTWNEAMIFGSIVSATDPVAVVALLKGAGASPQLTITIIGESLMNDGTAMVLFTLYYNIMSGDKYDAGKIFAFFLSASVGAVLVGVAMGLMTVYVLKLINRPLVAEDTTLQIALTFCCAYLSFYIAQEVLYISGVLCCCAAGVMLAWLAPPLILSHESMHNVWGTIEWLGNSLIFLLAGLIFGSRTIGLFYAIDYIYAFCVYLFLMLVRFFILIVMYPALKELGHKCSFNDCLFMAWGGLRGALAILLALIVEINYEKLGLSILNAERLFFYVGSMATFTLMINANSANIFLKLLGLVGVESTNDRLILSHVRDQIRQKIQRDKEEVCRSFGILEHELSELTYVPSILTNPENENDVRSKRLFDPSRALLRKFQTFVQKNISFVMNDTESRRDSTYASAVFDEDLLAHIRSLFLEIVRVKYWRLIHEGKLPRESFASRFLLYTIDVGIGLVGQVDSLYRTRMALHSFDWACLLNEIETVDQWFLKALSFCDQLVPNKWKYFKHKYGSVQARKDKRVILMLTSFIEAHEYAQNRVRDFVSIEEMTRITMTRPDETRTSTESQSTNLRVPEEDAVLQESKSAVTVAMELLRNHNPQIIKEVRAMQASQTLLSRETHYVNDMVGEGLLSEKNAGKFFCEINRDLKKAQDMRLKIDRIRMKKMGQALSHSELNMTSVQNALHRASLRESEMRESEMGESESNKL